RRHTRWPRDWSSDVCSSDLDGFDGVENGEAAAAEHFEVNTETFIDHFCERQSPVKQRARAGDKILHQTDIALVKAALHDVALGEIGRASCREREEKAAVRRW